MASKRALEGRLAELSAFEEPDVELEQYATPAPLAATLIHLVDLEGDLERPVVDLGTGTGVLALGAAMRGARQVLGIERDREALETARANETVAEPASSVDWVLADATRPPIKRGDLTVLMNPPFGAQHGHQHADRAFLEVVAELASVSYSIHNDGSWEFVEAFSVDNGGLVTHAYQSTIDLDRQFPFHTEESREHPVEVFRIEWG